MIGPITRIILRILGGIMIGYGLPSDWVGQVTQDPDVLSVAETVLTILLSQAEIIVGVLTIALTEWYYALAKRYGWKT